MRVIVYDPPAGDLNGRHPLLHQGREHSAIKQEYDTPALFGHEFTPDNNYVRDAYAEIQHAARLAFGRLDD